MHIYDEIRSFFHGLLDQFFNGGCWKLFYCWSKSTKYWQKILLSPLSKLLFGFQVLNLDAGSHESLPFTKQTLHIMSQLQVCPALKALFLYDLGLISKLCVNYMISGGLWITESRAASTFLCVSIFALLLSFYSWLYMASSCKISFSVSYWS